MSYPTRTRDRPSRQSYTSMPQYQNNNNNTTQPQAISIPTIPNLNSTLFQNNNNNTGSRNHQLADIQHTYI
ncbi:hypothetical protein I302_102357 [Kwoniella bestiolae CBS 10118]|uniref:Uncharacterized protein n=1 Tax=Kwoniella bestiolae CBS 10118 TaxID=1296100 RepID=A0AAJ8K3J0_9TREE